MTNSVNPMVHAFFVGRAVAQGIGEQLEKATTDALSEFGKFDAEQRERFRSFTEQVLERAEQEQAQTIVTPDAPSAGTASEADLQEVIDTLRAEMAELRAKLQQYRDSAQRNAQGNRNS
jgi:septal ring factor EnvC (AmiA/AmiB activator)